MPSIFKRLQAASKSQQKNLVDIRWRDGDNLPRVLVHFLLDTYQNNYKTKREYSHGIGVACSPSVA